MTDKKVCVWWLDHDLGNYWSSECGLYWGMANDDTPKNNQMNYCPKCGNKLVEALDQ